MKPGRIRCPYCGFRTPPAVRGEDHLRRCEGCNLFIRDAWLVEEPLDHGLERLARDFCPFCGFPVRQEMAVPEAGPFACPGCAGTLEDEILTTQLDIEQHRKKSMKPAGYLVLILVTVFFVLVTIWFFLSGYGR